MPFFLVFLQKKVPAKRDIEIKQSAKLPIHRFAGGQISPAEDSLALESPLEIRIVKDGQIAQTLTITMRTPGNDTELALGFLWAEGVLTKKEAFQRAIQIGSSSILLTLSDAAILDKNTLDRNFLTNSSCGVCGKNSLDFMKTNSVFPSSAAVFTMDSKILLDLPQKLFSAQSLFAKTGGNHAAALFDLEGRLLVVREDVGRHNALDKVLGWAFLNEKMPLSEVVLLVSGRASFELVQKASMAGIGLMAAVGAPSSLAVALAESTGMSLVGFLKKSGFNVYSGVHRF